MRIANIDAPELPGSPKCEGVRQRYAWCDFRLAFLSRGALERVLAAGAVQIERRGIDRYGRTLALVTVNGRDAGQYLVEMGLARRWR